MGKIKGGDLMLFIDGKAIAFATSHTISISGDTQDTTNKDESSDWASSEVSTLSWSATSDNLYSDTGNGKSFADLFDLMVNKSAVDAIFAIKAETVDSVPTEGWSPDDPHYKGKVIITSLEVNAPSGGEYATYSAQFTGVGALTKVDE